jgi:hypothetical protein
MPTPASPNPPQRPDENALRLVKLQEYLRRGLSLSEAVKAVNNHFKVCAEEAEREAA